MKQFESDWEKKFHETISLFYDISNKLSNINDLGELFKSILKMMSDKLSVSRGIITILNRNTSEIFISEAIGLTEEEQAKGRYQIGEGITGNVVENGEPIVVPDIRIDPRFLNRTGGLKEDSQRAFISVPIKSTTETVGALGVDKPYINKDALQEDLKLITVIATMISRAVRLHQGIYEENQQLLLENQRLTQSLKEKYHPENIIGTSGVMKDMYSMIQRMSMTNATALILGESGVGKELVAKAIHYGGIRAEKPFVTFNCAALPENLIESELFGYERGAFTGAEGTKAGKFEIADGGTIFLDEVGELSLVAQSKLLRVLQEKEIEKVGSNGVVKVDVRIIAATNRDLLQEVEKGKFRSDLYYRLDVFPIMVPPLRFRKSDIALLADYFIKKYAKENRKRINRISTPAIDMLLSYHWPGNVRELENCIERATILADSDVIHGYHLPPSLQTIKNYTSSSESKLQNQLDLIEYEFIIEELKRTEGKAAEAAEALGITYRQFGLRLEKYKINVSDFKSSKK